ncbi:MAG: DEAD/DEAH box helicase [Bacteroidetes bacterium]|nr:MAG: DEAD/DEAH box helicase [Bacteroidota bacterium]
MKFDEYHIAPEIKRSLRKLGFKRPTDIQYKAIPPILKGEDVLAVAQTGTGKTAAFAIPILHILHQRLKKSSRKSGIKCLVMVPTHELAMQIEEAFKALGQYTRVKVMSLFGGVEQAPQIERLRKRVDVLIATPGRVFDLLSQGHLQLQQVEILVLDEADHMLDIGFLKDIRDLTRKLPHNRQTLFFSATIDEKIKKLAYSLIRQQAIRIQISPQNPVAKNVDHAVAFVAMDDKRFFLERLIRQYPTHKILVFVRTKVRAERVQKALARAEIQSDYIHSGKDQQARNQLMARFKSGQLRVLIATDITARGIDFPRVDLVVNYDLPQQAENYVHRVGRTGRGNRRGMAISFCSQQETSLLEAIQSFLGKDIEVLPIDPEIYEEVVHSSPTSEANWKQLLAEEENRPKSRKKKKKK